MATGATVKGGGFLQPLLRQNKSQPEHKTNGEEYNAQFFDMFANKASDELSGIHDPPNNNSHDYHQLYSDMATANQKNAGTTILLNQHRQFEPAAEAVGRFVQLSANYQLGQPDPYDEVGQIAEVFEQRIGCFSLKELALCVRALTCWPQAAR